MQQGQKWNPKKMMWFTVENSIDTSRKINPMLVKFSVQELISNMPEQFKRLTLNNPNDCKFLVATCTDPIRAFSVLAKMSTKNKYGNGQVTVPFEVIDQGDCRRIMMKFTDVNKTPEENKEIRESKHNHLLNCRSCFITFSRVGYFMVADYTYAGIFLHELSVAASTADWSTKNRVNYFYTDDIVGCDFYDDAKVGATIKFVAGGNQLQVK